MNLIFTCLPAVLFVVVGINCKTENAEPARKSTSTDALALKVTATADDPCRIVLKQQKFIDTSISRDVKTVAATLLSDGSGYRELFDENSLKELYVNATLPATYYLSGGLQTLVYDLDLWSAGGIHDHVKQNVFLHRIESGARDSLFSEDSSYTENSRTMLIADFKINPAANRLIVSTDDFIRCYDLQNGSYLDIGCRVPFELLWTGNSAFIYNQRLKSKTDIIARSIRYDITSKNSAVLRSDDTLPLKNASATQSGDLIFRYRSVDIDDTSGKQGDSLYFCDSFFKTVASSFIPNEQNLQYTISLSGKWIYYTDDRAVRRIAIEVLQGISISLDSLNAKAQIVFPFPIVTDGEDITAIAQGTITQILPLQNGTE